MDACVLLAVVAVLSWLTIERNADYGSESRMLGKTAVARPHNFRAQLGLISCLLADGRINEADSAAGLLLNRLASAEKDKSIRYRGIAAGNVEYYLPEAHNQLGRVLLCKGNHQEAEKEFRRAIQLKPDSREFYNNLAFAMFTGGDVEGALGMCKLAIAVDPRYPNAYSLMGYILKRDGKYVEAIESYRKSLDLAPGQISAKCDLAWLLATSPVDGARNGDEAVKLGTSACEATGYQSVIALDVLASAYAEKGEYDTATQIARMALALSRSRSADSAGPKAYSEITGLTSERTDDQEHSIEARIALYEARRPFRDAEIGSGGVTPINPTR